MKWGRGGKGEGGEGREDLRGGGGGVTSVFCEPGIIDPSEGGL